MKKPRILINIHYLEIGGAERALIGLLHALDPKIVDVDLLLNQHTGEFLKLVPKHVNLLPQLGEYSAIERPIRDIVKEGHFGIALRRLIAKLQHRRYLKRTKKCSASKDESIYQYVFRAVTPALRDLSYLGTYDLAISFLTPHNVVLQKVSAHAKACWIHTDYSTVHINTNIEQPVWGGYDYIAAVSDDAGKAFANRFPTLADRVITIENILSPAMIRQQAELADVSSEMPADGAIKILSIGRYCEAKRFDQVPRMCRVMLDKGLDFHWYIIGYGDDAAIRRNIEHYGVSDRLILLGKKDNPYPYIKACDIYAQPSCFEGKSVTVREAQILCRPVVISRYPTAQSQLTDGVDGRIVDIDVDACATGVCEFARDTRLQQQIMEYLSSHDYGNEDEVQKIYDLMKGAIN